MSTLDFENVFLGGPKADQGRFKISSVGMGFKSSSGEIITIAPNDIKSLEFLSVARDHQLRIKKKNNSFLKFDGFKKQDYDGINVFCRQHFNVPLEPKAISTRGYNWGNIDFESSQLIFSVGDLEAFEVPLNQVASTKAQGKNEVTVEFNPSKSRSAQDSLVEVRFYVPGTVTQGQVIDDGDNKILRDKELVDGDDEDLDGEQGEISKRAQEVAVDDSGQELNAAQLLVETIKQKSNIDESMSELIVELDELLCLTPRGRFQVDFHEDFFRLRGKSNDYRINYSTISHLFLLPKPDDMHWNFILSLNPPIRQGNTRYPFLVFQFDREDEIEASLNISDEKIAASNGQLEKEYDGPTYRVVSDLFAGMSNRSVIGASQTYSSAQGFHGLKTSVKALEAYLYPLDKGFLVIPKPSMYIRFVEISVVTFARVTSGATTTKTFEFKISTTSGQEFSFSSIPKEEFEKLESFCKAKNLHTRNDLAEETSYRVADLEESESEDEDFIEGKNESESDVNEEFNEDYDSDSNASQKSAGSDEDNQEQNNNEEDEEEAMMSAEEAPKRKGKTSEGEPKKKAKREKKPGPKRPLTSFLYFSQDKRASVKNLHPEFSLGDTGKELGRLWKECSEQDKKPYEELAAKDKERYNRELEEFKKTGVLPANASSSSKPKAQSAPKKPSFAPSAIQKPAKNEFKSAEYVDDDEDDF